MYIVSCSGFGCLLDNTDDGVENRESETMSWGRVIIERS